MEMQTKALKHRLSNPVSPKCTPVLSLYLLPKGYFWGQVYVACTSMGDVGEHLERSEGGVGEVPTWTVGAGSLC